MLRGAKTGAFVARPDYGVRVMYRVKGKEFHATAFSSKRWSANEAHPICPARNLDIEQRFVSQVIFRDLFPELIGPRLGFLFSDVFCIVQKITRLDGNWPQISYIQFPVTGKTEIPVGRETSLTTLEAPFFQTVMIERVQEW